MVVDCNPVKFCKVEEPVKRRYVLWTTPFALMLKAAVVEVA